MANNNGRIYQLGHATGNVIESTGKGFSEATSGIPWWGKATIIAGGVGVAGYLSYYLITQLTGTQGGSCTTPGTPCYEALQPYQQQYQTCANQYSSYLSQFLKENATNGTGFTTAQLNELNYLSNCMNTASQNIATTAAKFAPQNPLVIVSYFAGIAVVTAVGLYFGAKGVAILRSTKSYGVGYKTGFQAAQGANDTGIRTALDDGTVTPSQASGIYSQYRDISSENVDYTNSTLKVYYTDNIITETELKTEQTAIDDAITEDATLTEEDLQGR